MTPTTGASAHASTTARWKSEWFGNVRADVLAGRFASAETALSDALARGSSDARTIVSLALVQVAQRRPEAARSLLAGHADTIPASDYGLAMAMAGDADEGVRILSQAIHDPAATARTRQNLAYAYALAGRWKDARLVVGMDLDPTDANKRVTEWAQVAAPGLAPQRVAALMGVTIGFFVSGQPVGLIALVGVVGLAGIVVNDSLVLVEFMNTRRADGMTIHDAVLDAGRLRLRPIVITSVTTIAGLLPLSFAGKSAPLIAPMATAISWGLLFATVLTLYAVPCLYLIVDRIAVRLGRLLAPLRRWARGAQTTATDPTPYR